MAFRTTVHPRNWPLWLQLTAGMLVIVLLVTLPGGELVREMQRRQLVEAARVTAQDSLELLAAATLEAVIVEDIPQLETIVSQLAAAEPDIYRIRVSNEDEVELVHWQRPRDLAEQDLLSYGRDISLEGETFGDLQLAMDMRSRYREVERQVSTTRMLSTALLVSLGLAMLVFIQWFVGRPVNRIKHRVEELAAGRHDGAPVHASSRDLDLLAGSVNALADALAMEEAHKRELREARDKAEAASRAKTRFLSSMSHELRTPMNAILGFAQLLESDPDEPLTANQLDFMQEISKAGNHLLALINEVLDLSRIESGRLTISMEPVDLMELIGESLSLMETLGSKYGIQIEAYPADAPPVLVQADRTRVKQVLLNLLTNAVKYNRPGGTVRVLGPERVGGHIRLSVEDNGPGLDAEQQVRVFEPFSRLDDSGQIEGTGIGLTICRRLMEMMGGRIGVDSEPGRGSRFWFELQAAAPQGGVAPVTTASADKQAGRPLLLYIEDNPSNLRLMAQVLKDRPALHLITAQQGGLGLEMARGHRPDLILLDLHLPDIDGLEVRRRLLDDADTRDIPAIVVSADTQPASMKQARKLGITDYFTKPLDVPLLLQTIDRALGRA